MTFYCTSFKTIVHNFAALKMTIMKASEIFEHVFNDGMFITRKNIKFSDAENYLLDSMWKGMLIKAGRELESCCEDDYFWVETGQLRVESVNSRSGRSSVLGFIYRHEIFTEETFPPATGVKFTVWTGCDCTLLCISRRNMEILCGKSRLWNWFSVSMLQRMIRKLIIRELYLSEPSPSVRYEMMLKTEGRNLKDVRGKHIASYLNMTQQTLSKIRADAKQNVGL